MSWRTPIVAVMAVAVLGGAAANAGAAGQLIRASGRVQAIVVHRGGPGVPGSATPPIAPLRVEHPAAYGKAKRAAAAPGPPPGASSGLAGRTRLTAVFGTLNASGLSAAQEMAQFGTSGGPVTP